jgi:pyroglutamyl-peptidase
MPGSNSPACTRSPPVMASQSVSSSMTRTILITGFGPFPGTPFNPSEPLAIELARRRHPAFASVRRVVHVFRVTYEAVDQELPALIVREKPAVLIMFGLASRTKHVRIETRARNVLTRAVPDADGQIPLISAVAPGAPMALSLRAPAQRLLMAARATGVPAVLSHDAGHYLCNYLCWRAAEAVSAGALRLAAFIHIPGVRRARVQHRGPALTLDDLARAGEAIVRTALAAAR